MSYYLIGVGGTGARCMEAFVYLTGAGLLKDSQPVKLVYVDADVSCGNLTKTQQSANLYEKAKRIGFGRCGLFENEIEQAKLWTPVDDKCKTMDDVFERTSLINKKETKPLGYLYESLFTEEERTTNLDKGFRGHPAIGAAVMNQKMSAEESPWKELLPQINSDKDAKIFIFASVFGGTGAAGFPTIAKLLHKYLNKDNNNTCVAKISGTLVLPYFQFPPSDDMNKKEMQAKVEEFMLNTKSALDYYNKSDMLGNVFTSIYMVGDNDLTEVKKFSLGSNDQKNEANIVEMYAALAAFDFLNKNDYADFSTPMIARGDDKADTIAWEDLPNICVEGNLKDKLGTFMRFLYVYQNGVLKYLHKCSMDQHEAKYVAWYKDLVQKAGKIDVYNDRQIMDEFNALGEFSVAFFAWMKDVIDNPNRKIELVNKQACSQEGIIEKFFKLDAYQVVLPVTERKDKLTGKEFWQQLCNYTKKMKKTNASGAEILMQAVYEICNK
jgi:hypothetical protein